MTPERRQMVRQAWGGTVTTFRVLLTATRDILALLFAILFAVAGTHARLVDEQALSGWDVSLCTLGVFSIFGYEGLRLWREKKSENGSRASTEIRAVEGP